MPGCWMSVPFSLFVNCCNYNAYNLEVNQSMSMLITERSQSVLGYCQNFLKLEEKCWGWGGVLPEKFGRGVRPASQNPYPIYDQNL